MKSLIWLSLGLTSLVALLMSIGFLFISPSMFGAVFFITMAIEWIVMEPVNRLLRLKTVKAEGITFGKMKRLEDAIGKQSVALECEYCNELNSLKIDLNGQNGFTCKACNNDNTVIAQFSTVRSATPVVAPPTDIVDELQDIEDELEAEING